MATSANVSWGSYKQYEGPIYLGKCTYKLPENPTEEDEWIRIITATEGGKYDAMNLYDRCILSSGLIQWCEGGQYSVSDMLGGVVRKLGSLPSPLPVRFDRNEKGRWRFFFDSGEEVDTTPEQQQLFLQCNGLKGSWTPEAKEHAKQWAAAVATIWEDPKAQQVQVEYTAKRLMGFVLPDARKVLDAAPPNNPIGKAFKAAYLSFAANNPSWANKHLQRGLQNPYSPWTTDWLIDILKELTFGPKVTIYPIRYNAIRKVLESMYGVNLPDFATELEQWQKDNGIEYVYSTEEIQDALINLGYDLGPKGADGSYGQKTRDAVQSFEEANGVPNPDGMPDLVMIKKLSEALEKKGANELSSGTPA